MNIGESHLADSQYSDFDQPVAVWTARLRALPGVNRLSTFDSMMWNLEETTGIRAINWRCLEDLNSDDSFLRSTLDIDVVDYAKKLLISIAEEFIGRDHLKADKSSSRVLPQFESILLVLWFCEMHGCRTVTNDVVDDLLRFVAFHRISTANPSFPFRTSGTPLAHYTICSRIAERRWLRVTEGRRGWPQLGFSVRLSRQRIQNSLRQIIEECYDGEMTWGDYKRGQSLESLGLDCGQYYVSHCMLLVRNYSDIAVAFVRIFDKIPEISEVLSVAEKTVEYNTYAILSGCSRRRAGLDPIKYATLVSKIDAALTDAGISGGLERCISRLSAKPTGFSYSSSSQFVLPKRVLYLVVAAATVSFVALAGWRRCEFGFSMSDLSEERNKDPLSQKSTPTRYFVNWYVSKTHGLLKQSREITEGQKAYLDLLQILNRGSDTDPCLLPERYRTVSTSLPAILGLAWEDFVLNGEVPSQLRKRLLSELPYWKLERCLGSICSAVRKGSYHNRPEDERRLLESIVDAETRRKLQAGDPGAAKYLVGKCGEATRTIERLRPTPYSFRHMWAEAMLRRFDGDIGWMIRSNFVHMGERFWRNYVRDKSTRFVALSVQHEVVSNLLYSALLKNGAGYSGPVLKVIRRLFAATIVKKAEDLSAFVESHIESFNPTPWGYCLVRKTARSRAQCADDGVPQTQNASPLVCLGCPNFLTSYDRAQELLFIANTHAEIAMNGCVPLPFRRQSGNAVKRALAHLSKLGVALPNELKSTLDELTSKGAISC